ncbi:mRNA-capping enzyme-like protein isoform X2 [Tanacetum coccineum]
MLQNEVINPRNKERKTLSKSKNPYYRYDLELFRVRRKDFYPLFHAPKLLKEFIPSLSHASDGLIFQPWDDPYVALTDKRLLKWKYPEMNSVDFLFEENVWVFMRMRPDKSKPNEFSTYKKVMRSIQDNITEEAVLNEIQNIIRLSMVDGWSSATHTLVGVGVAEPNMNPGEATGMESSATREYPLLIHTFFLTHTVNGVFLNPEDKVLYDEMLRLQGLGSNTATGQRTVIPPSPPCTHSSDVAKLKKREKVLSHQVNMFMKLFRSNDKFSQMFSQLESQPEISGGSGSGGCGDDEQGDDEDDGEDGEDEDDS